MKQKAITISLIKKNNNIEDNAAEQRMTSLEIAELTGKQHKNVMQAIRNMEPAWEKVTGLKFQLCEKSYLLANGVTKKQPFYQLTKTECLYIATKFNDEARARLVLRWQELEMDQREALEWERWKARWSQIERPKGSIALLGCTEEEILDEADDIIGEELDELNQRSDDCYTPSEIGKPFGLEGRDLNSFLCDQGIIQWAKGQWMPTRKFMNQGLTENRSVVIHGRNGRRRTVSRLVWTAKGRDFIMNIIKQ
jgi:phage regulator Rha-like protein